MKNFMIKKNGKVEMIVGPKGDNVDVLFIELVQAYRQNFSFPILHAECLQIDEQANRSKFKWEKIINIDAGDVLEICRTNQDITSEPVFDYMTDRATPEDTNAYCSFCKKRRIEVNRLIGGPDEIKICDECVSLLSEMMEEV